MLGVTLFNSEEALRKGDEAMNAGAGNAGSRASVDFYEVPSTLSRNIREHWRMALSSRIRRLCTDCP